MATLVKDLPVELQAGELTTRYVELEEMALRHLQVPAGTDFSPVLQGLPGDRCPSPHWGMVLEGSVHLRHEDGSQEHARAGEVFYWPAGHTGWTDDGVVFIEIGPLEPMRRFAANARKQLGL